MKWNKAAWSAVLTFIATLVWAGSASAATLFVDDDKVQCPLATFTTIQAAVNAASSGDIIKVCPGLYIEQVTIPAGKNNLNLQSTVALAAIIKAPPAMALPQAIVRVNGALNATICSFTITGPGDTGCASIAYGVRVDNGGSATIQKNHITLIQDTPFSGCQNGVAIQVGRQADATVGTATIQNNVIDGYQKNGITVDNNGSSATIMDNTIVGAGPTPIIAQNGVQVSRGATANVVRNTISGNQYALQPATVSTGVLLFQAGAGVLVAYNTIRFNDEGVYLFDTDGAKVTRNTITGSTLDGVVVEMSENNEVSCNTITGSGADGIFVTDDSSGNTIKANKISLSGQFDAEDDSTGGGTAGTANTWDDNICTTDNPDGLCE